MDLGIKGKTALVLASSRGLGQAMAHSLAREGVQVAVTGRNAEGLAQTVKMIESVGGKALALNWDLAELNAIDGHVQTIENQLGPVDILINNTGGPPPTPASGQDPQLWQKSFQEMVLSLMKITDAYRDWETDRKSTRLNSSHSAKSRMPSSA